MAGTTMIDSGLVLEAFRTIEGFDVVGDEAAPAEAHGVETMGHTTTDVFATLFSHRALKANEMFDRHVVEAANGLGVSEVPGARTTVETLLTWASRWN
jgi:hypothetical protein